MNQRQQIFSEYLTIKNLLNTSNKHKNEQTFLRFEVSENETGLRSVCAKISEVQKLQITQEDEFGVWKSSLGCEFKSFSSFLIFILEKYDVVKFNEKIVFDEYFYRELNKLLGFK